MSVRIMGGVWDVDLPPTEKLVLLALADHADHEGGRVHPGIRLLANKTGLGERTVIRTLKAFEDAGILTVEERGGGRGHPTHYRIVLDAAPRLGPPVAKPELSAPRRAALLADLMIESGPVCCHCGRDGDEARGPDGKPWHIDRIVHGSAGGTYVRENVQLSCAFCNLSRKDRPAPKTNPATVAEFGAVKGAVGNSESPGKGANGDAERVPTATVNSAIPLRAHVDKVNRQEPSTRTVPPSPQKGAGRKPLTEWPPDFDLTDGRRRVALRAGVDPDEEFERFRDKAAAKGYRYADWDAAWRNWVKSPYQQAGTIKTPGAETMVRPGGGSRVIGGEAVPAAEKERIRETARQRMDRLRGEGAARSAGGR